MSEELECMCLNCGISVYLSADAIVLDDSAGLAARLVKNCFCTECGGQLTVVGKAGDEPLYRLQ
jgi:hypothetical protein